MGKRAMREKALNAEERASRSVSMAMHEGPEGKPPAPAGTRRACACHGRIRRASCWRSAFFHYIPYTTHYTHTHPLITPHTPHCRPPPASSASPSLPNLVPAHRPTLPGLGHPVDVPIPPVASALCQTCLPRCSRKLPAMLPTLLVPLPTAVRLCNSDSAAYYARHDHYSAYPPPQTHTFNIALSSPQPSPPRIVTQIQPHRRRTPPDQGRGVLV